MLFISKKILNFVPLVRNYENKNSIIYISNIFSGGYTNILRPLYVRHDDYYYDRHDPIGVYIIIFSKTVIYRELKRKVRQRVQNSNNKFQNH